MKCRSRYAATLDHSEQARFDLNGRGCLGAWQPRLVLCGEMAAFRQSFGVIEFPVLAETRH